MTTATYQGRDDLRILRQGDLAKAGVEIEGSWEFPFGIAVEVTPEIAKALAENEGLYGHFEIALDEPAPEESKADEKPSTNQKVKAS